MFDEKTDSEKIREFLKESPHLVDCSSWYSFSPDACTCGRTLLRQIHGLARKGERT